MKGFLERDHVGCYRYGDPCPQVYGIATGTKLPPRVLWIGCWWIVYGYRKYEYVCALAHITRSSASLKLGVTASPVLTTQSYIGCRKMVMSGDTFK